MNQGKELWLGLEDYILESARTSGFTACVFTGPVNRNDDSEIKPGVLAPREFWKLVVMVNAERESLHATAYLLSQGDLIRELLGEEEPHRGQRGNRFRPIQNIPNCRFGPRRCHRLRPVGIHRRRPHGDSRAGPRGDRCPLFVALERREDIRA